MTDKELASKYFEYYQAYKSIYEDNRKYLWISAMLQGVCLEISSDISKYISKNKKSPEDAENRLKIIQKALNNFDYLINENFRQKELNNLLMNKNLILENKIKELEAKITSINDFNS